MLNLFLQLLGIIAFCTYMGSIYHLSRLLLCSHDSARHALYWVLPIAISAALFKLMGGSPTADGSTMPTDTPLFAMLMVAIGPLALHLVMATFIFRCRSCGLTINTYKVWWRKGTYWCPRCNARYLNGKPENRS